MTSIRFHEVLLRSVSADRYGSSNAGSLRLEIHFSIKDNWWAWAHTEVVYTVYTVMVIRPRLYLAGLEQLEEDTGLSVGAAWIAGQDRSMWRTLRPLAGQAQQWVSEEQKKVSSYFLDCDVLWCSVGYSRSQADMIGHVTIDSIFLQRYFLYGTITWSGDMPCDVVFMLTNHCFRPKRCAYPESVHLTD